ncbi:putative regulatory protein, FmdB family [Dissulfuribacter thermophilus]|uniref:Putative regulatory protein, FmdB family n=1 Tax=Dissulfuribacter thermophilus TaxID=1156395 RepID=A0A1B9F3E4_9BACT|nr:zinc ribbon domain-containing protein [Dissulfuribacter thermophilus]OCC14354.1 putative regulatory protein, FmdB family [Dissulfuribacter thermophilus]
MPIHEFKCESCDYEFELLIMNKEELEAVRCPKCQSPECNKLMSASNFSVAGGGQGSSRAESTGPNVKQHSCDTGSCTSFNLPGYK